MWLSSYISRVHRQMKIQNRPTVKKILHCVYRQAQTKIQSERGGSGPVLRPGSLASPQGSGVPAKSLSFNKTALLLLTQGWRRYSCFKIKVWKLRSLLCKRAKQRAVQLNWKWNPGIPQSAFWRQSWTWLRDSQGNHHLNWPFPSLHKGGNNQKARDLPGHEAGQDRAGTKPWGPTAYSVLVPLPVQHTKGHTEIHTLMHTCVHYLPCTWNTKLQP